MARKLEAITSITERIQPLETEGCSIGYVLMVFRIEWNELGFEIPTMF